MTRATTSQKTTTRKTKYHKSLGQTRLEARFVELLALVVILVVTVHNQDWNISLLHLSEFQLIAIVVALDCFVMYVFIERKHIAEETRGLWRLIKRNLARSF